MQKIKLLLLAFSMLFLMGCVPVSPPSNLFVTSVEIQMQLPQETLRRSFTDPQKIEMVLYYLRDLETGQYAEFDPERLAGSRCRIDLHYCDGTTKQIFQISDRYLSKGFHPWQKANPKKTAFFYPLLKSMPSD